MRVNVIDWVFLVLLIVGGLNWGLVGLLDLNLVSAIFGVGTVLSNFIYVLVGIAALYVLVVFVTKTRTPTVE